MRMTEAPPLPRPPSGCGAGTPPRPLSPPGWAVTAAPWSGLESASAPSGPGRRAALCCARGRDGRKLLKLSF
jgi:hypothetical protein